MSRNRAILILEDRKSGHVKAYRLSNFTLDAKTKEHVILANTDRESVARCDPRDKYDFGIGAMIALGRLVNKPYPSRVVIGVAEVKVTLEDVAKQFIKAVEDFAGHIKND